MDELREKLESIRFENTNWEARHFIPDDKLFDVISESAINLALRSSAVPLHEIIDLTDSILRGARRCFAILVFIRHGEAISGFFRHDSLRSHPDDRLPYTSEALQQIFEKDEASSVVRNFLEKQWEFFIPIILQHSIDRILDKRTILPFLHEESAGEGAMGVVSKVKLHPQCHRLPLQNHEVARKQIRHGAKRVLNFQQELRSLALLTHLKHPNIVQLYCAYQYRQEYNLIFAVADGGSLADLLNGKRNELEALHLPLALAGLADAVDAMHNFMSEALDVSLSGCHHDLAPRNVLIHGKTFLLADLGLSSFQHMEDCSSTTFIGVDGPYAAPELQTFRDSHVQARRASDIWSFGCILAEVLTYMVKGSDGVKTFCDKREYEWAPGTEWIRFHRGPETPSPEVILWLNDLQAGGEPYRVRMVGLIQKMLLLDPMKRPCSAQVKKSLHGISILFMAEPVGQDLDIAYNDDKCIDLLLGNKRFQSWLFAFNQLLDAMDQTEPSDLDFDFPKTVQALEDMRHIFEGSGKRATDTKHLKYPLLRYQHARLMEALPPTYRSVAKEHLVNAVLREDDAKRLNKLSAATTDVDDKDIGTLLAVKHLTALAEAGHLIERTELVLNQRDITLMDPVDIHHLASLVPASEHILVEWLRYKESWADKNIGTTLRRRLTTMANLLHNDSTTQIPGSLRCRGIFHDESQPALGFVYDIPPGTQPVTLHRLLDTEAPPNTLLEYRFRLAFDICRYIYTFHKVGWLHRNLHSMNVLFFPPKGAEKAEWAKEPRILGFAGSRENQIDSHTHGPDIDSELQSYQHPEYLTRTRYREEFDYYSVGMILLEIGLWKTLSRITKSKRFKGITDEDFRREVLTRRVPLLGISMGTRYMEATRICLEGGFGGMSVDADGGSNWSMAFKSLVMDRIPTIE